MFLNACYKFIPRRKRRSIKRPKWLSGIVKKALNTKKKLISGRSINRSQDLKPLNVSKEQRKLCKNIIRMLRLLLKNV